MDGAAATLDLVLGSEREPYLHLSLAHHPIVFLR
jgi:hypothetical protein